MSSDSTCLSSAGLLICNYYLTTFSIWLGHWSSHLKRNPLAPFHFKGHHRLYPDSGSLCSLRFKYGQGKEDSTFALMPPLLVQAFLLYTVLPLPLFLGSFLEGAAIAMGIGYVHIQTHLQGSALETFRWFRRTKSAHSLHHDMPVNYMVADHFWDRVFGTHLRNEPLAHGSDETKRAFEVGSRRHDSSFATRPETNSNRENVE